MASLIKIKVALLSACMCLYMHPVTVSPHPLEAGAVKSYTSKMKKWGPERLSCLLPVIQLKQRAGIQTHSDSKDPVLQKGSSYFNYLINTFIYFPRKGGARTFQTKLPVTTLSHAGLLLHGENGGNYWDSSGVHHSRPFPCTFTYVLVLSCFRRVRLCNPMDCSPRGSSVHGILPARILQWVAMPFSRGSSQPRDQTHVFCVQADSLLLSHLGSPTFHKCTYM